MQIFCRIGCLKISQKSTGKHLRWGTFLINLKKVTPLLRTKSSDDNIERQEPVEEIIIPPEKREVVLNKLRKVL